MEKKLIITQDGSHSIFVPALKEHYHSTFGAIQESGIVYIENGLKEILKSRNGINIFEMGFGTGLNAYLTFLYIINQSVKISYTAIEAFPLEPVMIQELNYAHQVQNDPGSSSFLKLHNAPWESAAEISESFQLLKQNISLLDFETTDKYDLIYFDAFAPDVQPELWTLEVFDKLYKMMNPDGILVTYCCKGVVKRNMKSAGFEIEKLPGPPGKREILRGRKIEKRL